MKTSAGAALNHKNPSAPPSSAVIMTAISPAPATCGTSRYCDQSVRPTAYVMTANAIAAVATQPVASPSRPSVRLTAFAEPVSTSTVSSRNGTPNATVRSTATSFANGT
jgi:hypothetical protein